MNNKLPIPPWCRTCKHLPSHGGGTITATGQMVVGSCLKNIQQVYVLKSQLGGSVQHLRKLFL